MIQMILKAALVGDVWVIWLLLALSVFSVAVMYERWRTFRANRADFPALLKDVIEALERGDAETALQTCRKSDSSEGRIAAAGLEAFSRGPAAVEAIMASRRIEEKALLERRLIILGTLGNNAPFIGLFGTVLGIIKAFHDLALAGSAGVAVVMAGIASALVATALGIGVAIPAVMANNYFLTWSRSILGNADALAHRLMAHLRRES